MNRFYHRLKNIPLPVGKQSSQAAITLALFLLIGVVNAEQPTIAVLDFEVNDLTLNPAIEAEKERAATLRPLMEQELGESHGYALAQIAAETQAEADKGFGYLYDKPALAAELGLEVGADYVIVGRVHKASFLFVYFKVLIVDVKSGRLVSEQIIEVKGPQRKFSAKGIEALTILVDRDIQTLINGS